MRNPREVNKLKANFHVLALWTFGKAKLDFDDIGEALTMTS